MLSFAAILALGFLLGMRHATDPDHVIAITTIVTKQRGIAKAGLIGALWGLGHTFTIFVLGTMMILFQVSIPPRVGLSMEFAVAAMLILLGVLNLTGVLSWLQKKLPQGSRVFAASSLPSGDVMDPRCRGAEAQLQAESCTRRPRLDRVSPGVSLYNVLRPLVIGIVHGLAGSAAVALLVMTTIHDPWWAIAYLLVFGVGTIAGMMLFTMAISAPFAYAGKRFAPLSHGLRVASGLISVSFGLFLTYQTGFVSGLFTAKPHWTPH